MLKVGISEVEACVVVVIVAVAVSKHNEQTK